MIKNLRDSTLSQLVKEDRMKENKDRISAAKSWIASWENAIISYEEELGGRGESSIIRYY